MENVRKLLAQTKKSFVLQYEGSYGMAHFRRTKRKQKASRYDLLWDERDGFLVVSNGKRQAVFYEGTSAKYAVIMLHKAAFEGKKPVKFY